jgi:hypothetical protein
MSSYSLYIIHINTVIQIDYKQKLTLEEHATGLVATDLFRKLGVLPLKSQFIFAILLFVLKNRSLFITNYDRHNIQTRYKDNLYTPTSSLILYQNGVYYTGIKIFNKLPPEIRELV